MNVIIRKVKVKQKMGHLKNHIGTTNANEYIQIKRCNSKKNVDQREI